MPKEKEVYRQCFTLLGQILRKADVNGGDTLEKEPRGPAIRQSVNTFTLNCLALAIGIAASLVFLYFLPINL